MIYLLKTTRIYFFESHKQFNIVLKFKVLLLICVVFSTCMPMAYSQAPKKLTSGEIYQQMEKLGFLGSVLYVAAHPDDENTRLISYLANHKKAHTTYLSLTRGDGGQNLIGPEISELLGVIRTQELLMARSVDNGHQMFTRANDFGYSKNAEETIKIWDTEKVKADVVRAIRTTRPDVIINRFDHRTSGETHGHHTASAQLSYELFDKSADPSVYTNQLTNLSIWQPRRLFFNTSWWFYGSEEKFKKADKSALMSMDVGVYFPLLGKSNTEIAAESRSKHKCQGFGSTGTRGLQMEYLELLKGDLPPGKSDIFEGINTTWSRVPNGAPIQTMVDDLLKKYNFTNPSTSVPALIEIYKQVQKTGDPFWKKIKSDEIASLIAACSGLFLEARTNVHKLTPSEILGLEIELINRADVQMDLTHVKAEGFELDTTWSAPLTTNEVIKWNTQCHLNPNLPFTAPYWLTQKGSLGTYHVEDQNMIGKPESARNLKVFFTINIMGQPFIFEKNVVYKFNSPENGETYRPLEIVPPLTVNVKEAVYVFATNEPKEVSVQVQSWAKDQKGSVALPITKGWTVTPEKFDFNLKEKGENKSFSFTVTPTSSPEEIVITPIIRTNDNTYSDKMIDITYDHIPYQTVLMKAEAKFTRLNIKSVAQRVAYISGAGDEIPTSLRQIGCTVEIIKPEDITEEKLSSFQTLILGVRAYNTEENLKYKQAAIFDFVKKGGTVVVQYNVSNGLVTKELAPYPLTLSRNRVTVEEAEMRFLSPEHDVLNKPNKITSKDFEGWVQERGLYFPGEWDKAFTPIFSCNDPGETPLDGSLLVAQYGEGYYVYTGLSFFRELPAGVSGAYRLFANLISLGHDTRP